MNYEKSVLQSELTGKRLALDHRSQCLILSLAFGLAYFVKKKKKQTGNNPEVIHTLSGDINKIYSKIKNHEFLQTLGKK